MVQAGQAVAPALVSDSKAPAFLAKAVGAGLLTKDTKELRVSTIQLFNWGL
jgi:hypothetical protein